MSVLRRAIAVFGRALRETGQATDRLGLRIADNELFRESFARHRPILTIMDKAPALGRNVFVAPNATIVGSVRAGNNSSVWYQAVVRGDRGNVIIGNNSNIQDRAVLQTVGPLEGSTEGFDVVIADNVTVGHGAVIVSSTIENNVMVGQGALIGAGSTVGANSIIAAGAVLRPNSVVPAGELWAGNPAKCVRKTTAAEQEFTGKSVGWYVTRGVEHASQFTNYSQAYTASAQRI